MSGKYERSLLVAPLAGMLALALWAVWWAIALIRLDLPLAEWTSFVPVFGADFTTQTDYAARTWSGMADPYADHRHLFHYPPIVIRLFAWTPYFSQPAALRIWVVVLALLMMAGTVVACRTRQELSLERLPLPVALACVLFSLPAVFALERANFDLITLAAILLALQLDRRGGAFAEIAAGCLLAVGPWVKIYPGLIGVALLALRRYRVFGGFVAGGIAIGLAAPAETLRSFDILRLAIERSQYLRFGAWSHSLSLAWLNIGYSRRAKRNSRPAKGAKLTRCRCDRLARVGLGLLADLPVRTAAALDLSAPALGGGARVVRAGDRERLQPGISAARGGGSLQQA